MPEYGACVGAEFHAVIVEDEPTLDGSRVLPQYRPSCSCGWVGTATLQRADADLEATDHEMEEGR